MFLEETRRHTGHRFEQAPTVVAMPVEDCPAAGNSVGGVVDAAEQGFAAVRLFSSRDGHFGPDSESFVVQLREGGMGSQLRTDCLVCKGSWQGERRPLALSVVMFGE